MICPYVQNSHINIQMNVRNKEYPDMIDCYVISEYWGNMTCPKEECGAWQEGECKYNGER